jgi:hypothetical protein
VATERIAGAQCLLQVHPLPGLPAPERRHLQRFERSVGREGIGREPRHRETAAAHADAVADRNAVQTENTGGEHEFHVTATRRHRANLAYGLNDTCEHGL